MKNPRDNIRYDIPKEWIINFKKGCCPVCGKTKFEFNKRMKVYCSKKCQQEYSKRIYTWQELADNFKQEHGSFCDECKKTKEQLTKEKDDYKINKRKEFLKNHPEIIEKQRKELMDRAEDYYQQAINLKEDDIHLYQYHNEEELPYQYDTFEVDHKTAVCNGGDFWDKNNLQILCYNCHKNKTKKDLNKRTKGNDKLE